MNNNNNSSNRDHLLLLQPVTVRNKNTLKSYDKYDNKTIMKEETFRPKLI